MHGVTRRLGELNLVSCIKDTCMLVQNPGKTHYEVQTMKITTITIWALK